jgi:uncharacterized membrane protein
VSGRRGIERLVAGVLLAGGLLSAALSLAGLVLYAAEGQPHGREIVRVVHDRAAGRAVAVFRSLDDVRRGLGQRPRDPLALVALGLVALLVTPVACVAAAIPAFWRTRDRVYALIASVVLGLLMLGLLLAAGG